MHYMGGGHWEPIDFWHDQAGVGGDFEAAMKVKGFDPFLAVGLGGTSFLSITTYRNHGSGEFALTVDDVNYCGPVLVVEDFPTLMDLIARWAPAVQSAQIVGYLEDLSRGCFDDWIREVRRPS